MKKNKEQGTESFSDLFTWENKNENLDILSPRTGFFFSLNNKVSMITSWWWKKHVQILYIYYLLLILLLSPLFNLSYFSFWNIKKALLNVLLNHGNSDNKWNFLAISNLSISSPCRPISLIIIFCYHFF